MPFFLMQLAGSVHRYDQGSSLPDSFSFWEICLINIFWLFLLVFAGGIISNRFGYDLGFRSVKQRFAICFIAGFLLSCSIKYVSVYGFEASIYLDGAILFLCFLPVFTRSQLGHFYFIKNYWLIGIALIHICAVWFSMNKLAEYAVNG